MIAKERATAKQTGWPRAAVVAIGLALVGVAMGAAALALTFGRSDTQASCRTTAWTAVPAASDLPAGWSTVSSRIFVDTLTLTLAGPAASGSTQGPAVFVSVTCYGADGAAALRRSHEAALAAGATDLLFAAIGDGSFAVRSESAGSTTVYIRRGILSAEVTSPSTVATTTLDPLAKAIDAAMSRAIATGPDGSGAPPAPAATATASASPAAGSAAPSASAAPVSHIAPDLEALLPTTVAGTTLQTQSVPGTSALGSNAASQALLASLQKLGKTAADLEVGVAYDPNGVLGLRMFVYRAKGVTSAELDKALAGSQVANASPVPQQTQVTVSGHKTTKLIYSQGVVYYYDYDGVVFVVQASDESLASQALALLK